MKWHRPPIIKIYEALGAIADGRVEISGNTAKVYSSTHNKYYGVTYAPDEQAIMANDNGSYWQGYLGYPAIAFLMQASVVTYDPIAGNLLKNIAWKDINQKFKNDFDKTLEYILTTKSPKEKNLLEKVVNKIDNELAKLDLSLLGKKVKPPDGY